MATNSLENETIELNELVVQVIRSARRKRLSIEVCHSGVIARAPARMRHATIQQFLEAKSNWIRNSLAHLPEQAAPLQLIDDCPLLVLGETYRLVITKGRKAVFINANEQIVVPISISHLAPEITLKTKLTKWYKKVALQHLELRVKNRMASMLPGVSIPKIKVRDYKRRWGSCDHKGELSFNWRIVMAPPAVLDYVVIHEIAHLKEFNHSKRFWKIVEQQMPDWKIHQTWLSENGSHLYRF